MVLLWIHYGNTVDTLTHSSPLPTPHLHPLKTKTAGGVVVCDLSGSCREFINYVPAAGSSRKLA
jgi:hypothetical protein